MKTYLNINSIQDKSIPGSKLEESYVSQENGKGLSTNDFTDILKNKLLSLNNYDDSELNEKLLKLEQNLNSILGEGSTEAIENFNEIISFLSGIEDSESLDNIIAAIELQISDKQDKINDLQKIREGASKGETALQDIPEEYITEDELENKGYLTEHQDITPEILQNENEVAIKVGNNTSNYTTINYSKFSNDLTGRIEATPEEFTFRPSAGDKSIRDESALIKRIKGNTIVWKQLLNISDPLNISFSENTDVYYQVLGRQDQSIRIIKGRKYLGTGYVETNIKTRLSFGISTSMSEGQIITSFGTGYYERIFEAASDRTSDKLYINNYSGQKGFLQGDYISCTLNLFDLTQMFGAGNEPTTVEEFKALFPNNYYDYNAGELVSMTSNGLFANGFNQLENEWEIGGIDGNGAFNNNTTCIRSKNFIPIIRGAHYYLKDANYKSTDRARVYLFDENFQFVDYWSIRNGVREFYKQASYFKVSTLTAYGSTTYKNDLCINLSHTGVRNGEYEPYWGATKDLSIIQKYFPNGMRSAGSIYDEIFFDEATQKWVAIQRVGSVDLGSLAWSYQTKSQIFYIKISEGKERQTVNIITAKYPYKGSVIGVSGTTFEDKSIYSYYNTTNLQNALYIYVKDTAYSDASSFKNAMSGVMLYYELAEPIITTIEEPIDLSYKVGDFGIEKMLSNSFSAPFKADIIYQFNATDRVRENSMNISKLSKKHNLLESEVDALESKALTTEEQNFSNDQKAQVATNLGGNTTNGLVRYIDKTIPVKSFVVEDSSGATHKYVFPIASDDEKNSATGGVLVTKSELDAIINKIYNLWYGIEWDVTVSTTQCTRIGNSDLHKSLPIQNKMRGCILNDNGEVVQYLEDWLSATRDGSIGQVMVEIPAHYRKFETDGNIRRVKISENALPDFHLVPKVYISAYEATVQRSTTKLCSVVNTNADYRGGSNNSLWDGTYRTLLGRPATGISLNNFRNYARKRNTNTTEWNCNDYNAYKILFWLYYIEYANKNCQLAFNSEKDSNGYAQGGLGSGVTTLSNSQWSGYNSYFPFVPCGYTDSFGNNSGILSYDLMQEDGTTLTTVSVNRYRGIELPFGHVWKWTDGISIKISPTVENGGTGESEIYVANDTENYNSTNYNGYTVVGLETRSNGYVKELVFGENGDIMPMFVGAGSTTYWADYHYTNIPTAEALRGVMFGGSAYYGAHAGLSCAYSSNSPSYADASFGSRLCFIPRAKLQE